MYNNDTRRVNMECASAFSYLRRFLDIIRWMVRYKSGEALSFWCSTSCSFQDSILSLTILCIEHVFGVSLYGGEC